MKDSNESKNPSAQLLRTDGGRTKSNAIEVPTVSLPKGGGAIKSMDEKLSVNAVNGTATFSIPLPVSPARDFSPSLNISYNSGGGNGIFGLGWMLNLPSVKRKTNTELPGYLDMIDSDTYLFSEAEDLVAAFRKEEDGSFSIDTDGNYIVHEKDSPDGLFTIRYYMPRIEGLFARIERWSGKSTREIKWRVITTENVTTLFGWSAESRISDPEDETRIFQWLPEFVFDDTGNCHQFIYKRENNSGLDPLLLYNHNRLKDGEISYTNLYFHKIFYGNKTPYLALNDPYPPETDYLFQTVFDYGEYNEHEPFDEKGIWGFRNDAFSDYKPGFEIRTTRLCKRVLLFHYFSELPGNTALIKSLNFEFETFAENSFTLLKSVTEYGYIKKPDNSYSFKNFPPIEFTYQDIEWNTEIKAIATDDLVHAPAGLDEPDYQFTDLFNEGLSGILTEQGTGWYYKHNLGNGKFEEAKPVAPKPSFSGLGAVLQLADLDSDGGKQIVNINTEPKGYFELSDSNEWQPFRTFKNMPNIDLGDANTRMIDLNGDGKQDILITKDETFTWYKSAGRKGFESLHTTVKPFNKETGPHIVFADSMETIFLADMSGDGMTDIVRIRNGEVSYWPNLGYGKFGARVKMGNSPVFDHPDSFNAIYIRLGDINGSGTTDIIYLGRNKFSCWLNFNGNEFSGIPFEIDHFPEVHDKAKIRVADLLGNGVACIVWSSPLEKDASAPLRYIDLMNSRKPYIMISCKNNLGKEVLLEYTPSTKYYIEDKLAGKPWITKLHFPVHCISRIETLDEISGSRFVSLYKYHHGYYDHAEKEFRGFGMVEQIDSEHFEHWVKGNASNIVEEELHQEPVVTKTWYHTGAFLDKDRIFKQYAYEYWYEEMKRQGFEVSHSEVALPDTRLVAAPGIDQTVLDHLSAQEWREGLRACKSVGLRSEIFARDASKYGYSVEARKKELTPFSVSAHNCMIELIQPKGLNKYAVFVVRESEAITYSYERNPEDPRISHNLNVKLDEYGNILESASVVYPRLFSDPSLPADIQEEQNKTVIIYTQNLFTNDVINDDDYRLRLSSEVKTFELRGVLKSNLLYAPRDFEEILSDTKTDTALYHEMDKALNSGRAQLRLIEHIRSTYYKDDLSGALPLHQLESLALPFENYQLAFTPELVSDIFGMRVTSEVLTEGKFTHSEGDNNWWVPSGIIQYTEGTETNIQARNRFYVPVSYVDPYRAKTRVSWYGNYFLFINELEDALGNKTYVDKFNFRTLSAQRMRDINANLSEVITDELGLVKAFAVMGKGTEADELAGLSESTEAAEITLINEFFNASDSVQLTSLGKNLLQNSTSRFIYDLDTFRSYGKPVVVASISREEHFRKVSNSPVQITFEYSNGSGEVELKKSQAEPGLAKHVIVHEDNTLSITDIDTGAVSPAQLRWIGNGRTIMNNKGESVKEYEPWFSVSPHFENIKELVETGVTPVMFYDAAGRLVRTEMPDGTFSKVVFDSWKQSVYDANDTVLESSWYDNRINRLIDAELVAEDKDPEQQRMVATKAAKHNQTPNTLHFDTLGRPIFSVEHNKNFITEADEFFHTRVNLDIESNLRSVIDARGNMVVQYKYDMLGNLLYQQSMDTGQGWTLMNILGDPLRTWDERDHEFQYYYDVLHRSVHSKVLGGDGPNPLDHIFNRVIYGENLLLPDRINEESLQHRNILGQTFRSYDTGGLVETPDFDFKGQPIAINRMLFRKYKEVVDWTDANLETDLESDAFTVVTDTDALGRITRQVTPDDSIITPSYNEAGLLDGETVFHPGADTEVTYIKDIDYNEKGLRNKIIYGNNVTTKFYYDKETFRLNRLESKLQNNDPLQDWYYTYDPVGNITHIEDKNIPVVFFNNQKVTGLSEYTYDAVYRLSEAKGRENDAALVYTGRDNWNDGSFMHHLNPGDSMTVRNYTQSYHYDSAGNILQMRHQASGNNWTRNYNYQAGNNRLTSTQAGSITYLYPHHARHGFITAMPHLEEMDWNFKEELVRTIQQRRTDGGTPETTYYQYDGQGQRIRKITDNQAEPGVDPAIKEERIYISGYELYKKYSGSDAGLERTTLSLMDEGHRFVMIETRNDVDDGTEKQLVRFQLHNHSGSAALETDDNARIISYEEYHPFGTTAYQAKNRDIKSAAKRYRYTGMERDEETGLGYHSARYYLPWLGRWLSPDPVGIADGLNLYSYVNNDPVNYSDVNGKQSVRVTEMHLQNMSPTDIQRLIVAGGGIPGRCYANPTFEQRQADISILRNILIRANLYDRSGIRVSIPARIVEDRTVVLSADSRGYGYIGPRYIVERQIESANFGYQLEVLGNIRGGLGGTIGYAVGGERGSYLGAAVDGLAMGAAGTARGRQANQTISRTPPPAQRTVDVAPQRSSSSTSRTTGAPGAGSSPPAGGETTPRDTRPYSAQRMRQQLEQRYGAGNVTSTTVPPTTHRSVRRAAVPVGGGRSVGFDERGLPDFSPFSITTARVTRGSYRGEMRAATRQVREALNRGESLGVTFTPAQLRAIRAGNPTIPGYRWHHVSGGELQLVPAAIHDAVPHIGSGAMRHGR